MSLETPTTSEGRPLTLVATEADVAAVIGPSDMAAVVDLIEHAYREKAAGRATLHPRQTLQYPPESGYYTDSALRILGGFLPGLDSGALRIYPIGHDEPVTDTGPRVLDYTMKQELLLYYRYSRGMELAGVLADHLIMNLRTAAPTGVASRHLARSDSRIHAVIGSGRHAPWQIRAVGAVLPIEEVRIYSPTAANRERLAAVLDDELAARVSAVESAREAVSGADVVTTVTNANSPVLDGDWLKEGTHVNVIARGEVDVRTLERAGRAWCSWREQILRDVPDFRPVPELIDSGRLNERDVHDLDSAVVGEETREADRDITVFLSQGVGIWDAAVASWAFRKLYEAGNGTWLDFGAISDAR